MARVPCTGGAFALDVEATLGRPDVLCRHAEWTVRSISRDSSPIREAGGPRTSTIASGYRANAIALGRDFDVDPVAATMSRASTDMGNVSQVVNAIHPYIGVGGDASNHQPAFARACVGPAAEQTLRDGALALAWTALDVARSRRTPAVASIHEGARA